MGFINDAMARGAEFIEAIQSAKVQGATDEARKAYAEGRAVLVYKIIEASGGSIDFTGPMTGVGEQIEAIEAEGWALANMATAESKTLSGDERAGLVSACSAAANTLRSARPAPGPIAPTPSGRDLPDLSKEGAGMSDVYVPERGDRYHLYEDCADIGSGQLGNTTQGVGTYSVTPMPLDQAETLKKTLCRTCRKTALCP